MAKMTAVAARGAMRVLGTNTMGSPLDRQHADKKPDDLREEDPGGADPIYITMIEGMGAILTLVDFGISTALATGVVDGQKNPQHHLSNNLPDAEFVMLTNHDRVQCVGSARRRGRLTEPAGPDDGGGL
jgi:hypothetical protein